MRKNGCSGGASGTAVDLILSEADGVPCEIK